MEENVVQINGGITINVNLSSKKYIFGILGSLENGKYLASFMEDSVITWDGIIKSYNKETKTVPQILM